MAISNLFNQTFTIINQIPTSQNNAETRAWKKHIIRFCDKMGGIIDKSTGTMVYKAGTWTVNCKDWEHYRPPTWVEGGYYYMPEYQQEEFWTANVGDLLIFSDLENVPEPDSVQAFLALRNTYRSDGGIITSAQAYIHFKPNGKPWRTNHIEIVKG